jgi:tRNA dimethylallyltransferase
MEARVTLILHVVKKTINIGRHGLNIHNKMQIFKEISAFLASSKAPLIAIIGPTASGKTSLSIDIAKKFNGEVISADSRQVYKYMDIGTEKVTKSQMEGIPHHLLDIVEPNKEFTLSDYKRLALKTIKDIQNRGKLPILCGGTGLYLNAIIENYQVPAVPPQYDIRQRLAQYYEEHGAEALHALLKEKDPDAAEKIHPNNVRYVIRALEVNIITSKGMTYKKGDQMFDVLTIGIDWDREILYDRINRRVDEQLQKGLLNEVKTLLMRGYSENLPSMSSLGYKELIDYLRGDTTFEEATENFKKNTRNYAKRQLTWFRRYRDVRLIDGKELESYLKNDVTTG